MKRFILSLLCAMPGVVFAATNTPDINLQMTSSSIGLFCLILFGLSYVLVMAEEFTHLRKSKPVVLSAGIIWMLIAYSVHKSPLSQDVNTAILHNILEYAELFLFLLVAMTYVNAMEERHVFKALRAYLIRRRFSYRQLFWITGLLSFFISPIADNLTTALLMCAVVMALGEQNPNFVAIACVNIVVAANAGGSFSPFGDITTLMVWQKGVVRFANFFHIFIPALVNYLVPAIIMHFAVPKILPNAKSEIIILKHGAIGVTLLFLLTIITAVTFHNYLHLPPVAGMMMGLGYLQFYGYYLKHVENRRISRGEDFGEMVPFDIFRKVERAEWDTLLFFYGIVLCVGGLATLGYLELLSQNLYGEWGKGLSAAYSATPANTILGMISSIIDNIPVMFSVLTMNPSMPEGQWLLITLTAGTGGSLLSIGSAAGVALMGQARGQYTFISHLKWTWAIALGYAASILVHLWLNQDLFLTHT